MLLTGADSSLKFELLVNANSLGFSQLLLTHGDNELDSCVRVVLPILLDEGRGLLCPL